MQHGTRPVSNPQLGQPCCGALICRCGVKPSAVALDHNPARAIVTHPAPFGTRRRLGSLRRTGVPVTGHGGKKLAPSPAPGSTVSTSTSTARSTAGALDRDAVRADPSQRRGALQPVRPAAHHLLSLSQPFGSRANHCLLARGLPPAASSHAQVAWAPPPWREARGNIGRRVERGNGKVRQRGVMRGAPWRPTQPTPRRLRDIFSGPVAFQPRLSTARSSSA